MKNTLIVFCLVALVSGSDTLADTQVLARVKGDHVNVRAKSDLNSETVGQLSEGSTVTVVSVEGEWVQIVPPDDIDFWIHKDFIENDTVLVKKLNARAGAGINYSVVGSFAKGDKVRRRGSFGEWVKVNAPPDASLWVSREYVDVVQPTIAVPPPVAAPRSQTPLLDAPVPASAAAKPISDDDENALAGSTGTVMGRAPASSSSLPPADLKLIPLDGQGKVVRSEGELKRAPVFLFKSPATHRLIKRDGNRIVTTAYIRGNAKQLDSLLNQVIVVQGKQYWVENIKVPVVVIEAIEKRNY